MRFLLLQDKFHLSLPYYSCFVAWCSGTLLLRVLDELFKGIDKVMLEVMSVIVDGFLGKTVDSKVLM